MGESAGKSASRPYSLIQIGGSISPILDDIKDYLNGLSENSQQNAKCVVSDQKEGKARGVVFHNSELTQQDFPAGGTWKVNILETVNSYENELYKPAQEFLEALPEKQAYHAKMAFSNYKGSGSSTLTIWYHDE